MEFELALVSGGGQLCRVETVSVDGTTAVLLLVMHEDTEAGRRPDLRARSSLRHDLAGPLTAILGTAELLLLRGQQLPREVRDSLGKILENCGRITGILADEGGNPARPPGTGGPRVGES